MPTWYLDVVNGSDYRGGDSWTVPAGGSGTDGISNGTTTFTSATATFTGMEGRYIWIGSNATTLLFWGTINTVSDANTVVLSGTVTTGSGRYFYVGGAWQSGAGALAARTAPGDTIRIAKSPDPYNVGTNFIWTNGKATVRTGTRIATVASAWTASENVFTGASTNATYNNEDEGYSQSIATNASFGTGLLAYKDFDSLDLSGYTRVTLQLYSSIALVADDLSILLDNTNGCGSPVETISIPRAFTANMKSIVDVPLANPASDSAIVSIGLQANRDFGAATVYIAAIWAYNTDDIGLHVDDMTEKSIWTASANITLGNTTVSGYECMSITPAAGFGTGIACYRDYASTVDWSDYDYVYVKISTGAATAAGVIQFYIDDTAGCVSPLETMTTSGVLGTGQFHFHRFTISNKAALSAVKSIGIGYASDPGTISLYVMTIFLGKSGGFNPDCIFGKDDTSNEWYAIRKCQGTNFIELGDQSGQVTGTELYFSDTASETTSGYCQETSIGTVGTLYESGSAGNPITYDGGWNTATNEKDGISWHDARTYNSTGFACGALNYITITNVGLVRATFNGGTGTNIIIDSPGVICSNNAHTHSAASGTANFNITIDFASFCSTVVNIGGHDHTVLVSKTVSCGYALTANAFLKRSTLTLTESNGFMSTYPIVDMSIGDVNQNRYIIGNIKQAGATGINLLGAQNFLSITGDITSYSGQTTDGIYISTGTENFVKMVGNIDGCDNGVYVYYGCQSVYISGPVIKNSSTADIYVYNVTGTLKAYFDNVDCQTVGKEVVFMSSPDFCSGIVFFSRWDKTDGSFRQYHTDRSSGGIGAIIQSNTAEAEAGSCIQCEVSCDADSYARFKVAGIPTETSGSRTISFKIKKDGTYDGDARPKAAVFQNGCLVTDYTAISGDVTESYVAYTITATKLEAGYYELWFEVNGTTGNLYIDTITWT
jgi:hypothetical protein